MPRRQRARSSEDGVKAEDFAASVLNFGGEDEDDDGQPAAAAAGGFKSKNLEAERRRRGRLNNNILALRAVVPNITKVIMRRAGASSIRLADTQYVPVITERGLGSCVVQMSKEHTLTDAIDYIKKLQSQVQEQLDESLGEGWEKQGIDSCSESFAAAEDTQHQVLASTFSPEIRFSYLNNESFNCSATLELKIYHHKTFAQFPAAIPPPVPQRTRYSYLDLQGLVELVGPSGLAQVPPQDLVQEGRRRVHQGAGSAMQLRRAGHQPEHHNVLRLRGERLLHRGDLLSTESHALSPHKTLLLDCTFTFIDG
jgi:hypothetical protein